MINHEFDIIRVLIASQDDEMIKKLILCLTEMHMKQSPLTIKLMQEKICFPFSRIFAGRPSDSNYE